MGLKEAREAATYAARLAQNVQTRIAAHRALTDPDLTPEGLDKRRAELSEASLASARRKAAALLKAASDGRAFVDSQVEGVRPKFDPNDVAQLVRTQQAWDNTIKPQLADGKSLSDIAASADMDGVMALLRFGPQQVNLTKDVDRDTMAQNLRTSIDQRLAAIHPDESARRFFSDAAEARAFEDTVSLVANGLDHVRTPADLVGITIGVKQALVPRGAMPTTPVPSNADLDTGLDRARSGVFDPASVTIPD
jgi:hypothetical protein